MATRPFYNDESLFQHLLEHSLAANAIFDTDMRYLAVTRRWMEDFHLGDRNIIGQVHYDVFPDVPEKWRDLHRRTLTNGEVFECEEEPFPRSDGTVDWVKWKMLPWRHRDGQIGGLIIFSELITKRKMAEAALLKTQERFRKVFEYAPIGIAVADLTGRFVEVNSAYSSIVGYSNDELRQKIFTEIVHPDSLALEMSKVKRLRADEIASFESVSQYVHKDGRAIWVHKLVSKLPDDTGKNENVLVMASDITSKRESEAAIEANRLVFEAALASMADSVFISDTEGRLLNCNDAFARFHRFKNRDECAETLQEYPDLLDVLNENGETVPIEQWPVPRALRGETIMNAEYRLLRKDTGETWDASYNFAPIRNESGNIIGSVVVGRDVTEQKRIANALHESLEMLEERVAERTQQLEEARKLAESANASKTTFLTAASHDLRQPLQSLSLYLSLLEGRFEDEDSKQVGKKMRSSISAIGALLNALLDISRFSRGVAIPRKTNFPIKQILDRIIENNSQQAAAKGLTISCDAHDFMVHSDIEMLERILENILVNGIRYTYRGGVTVKCHQRNGVVSIEISDTGIGIPEEDLEKIFDEFVQLNSANQNRTGGFGFGLAIVKHLGRLLEHPISVTSTLGKGSTFTVEVPVGSTESRVSSTDDLPPEKTLSQLTVLLVDDDADVLDATELWLQSQGMTVQSASSGQAALSYIINGYDPDVLVADYRLPDLTGLEVLQRIRQVLAKDVPAVLLTGDTSTGEIRRRNIEDCIVLQKPAAPQELRMLIERMAQTK